MRHGFVVDAVEGEQRRIFCVFGAFGVVALSANGACTGKGGGDVFASGEDILCEEAMEGGKERLITAEDHMKTRSGKCS